MPSLLSSLFGRGGQKSSKTFSTGQNGQHVSAATDGVEQRAQQIGRELLDAARANAGGLLSKKFWNDKLMDYAMKDPAFKVQLFRFVDTFPTLKTPEQIYDHLVDYMSQPDVKAPPMIATGMKAGGVMKGTFAKTMASQITGMANGFIAGTDAKDALPKLAKLWKNGLAFSVDLLGEACVSDAEADVYLQKYLDLVENLPAAVKDWPANERLEKDHLGDIPRTNVSIKVSSLTAQTDPIAFERVIDQSMGRIVPILEAAKSRGVFINFDMESFATKDLTIELFKRCCRAVDFEGGIAMQAYLRSGDADATDMADWAKAEGRQVTVRLVKGAYWDYETIHAEEMGWPQPVWPTKPHTDACFERMARTFIGSTPTSAGEGGVKLACGSHNVRSIAVALAALEKRGLPNNAIELQMLYGMAGELKDAAEEFGLRVREYVPVGDMIPGMAYLVRRLLENTSNESWLKAGFLDDASPEQLLGRPDDGGWREMSYDASSFDVAKAAKRHHLSDTPEPFELPFYTEPMRDFAHSDTRQTFGKHVGKTVPPIANDGTVEQADVMVEQAVEAQEAWAKTSIEQRAKSLMDAAAKMRERRDELAGMIVNENGKDWRNADADVCEAIDFLEYYAREAISLFQPTRLGKFIGELDQTWHHPRGVVAVISPWNFPLAITCGMTAAALVTGNTVALKPAEQTPGIAKVMCDILWQAGVPEDVLHFLPGQGETVGAHLVRHPQVDMIAFTGSAAVGQDILQAAATHPPTGKLAKHVVCETGGKNSIIVDASADLDEAVVGVRDSAFGFQGQKCSACSRVIVVESAHDLFVERLVEATKSLHMANPADPACDVGPVIDNEAAEKIRSYIELGKQEATLAYEMPTPDGLAEEVGKPFVGPTIFTGVDPGARVANEEIFGPVLAVIKVPDFDTALQIANAPHYKLTGGVYSRMPSHLERARDEFVVGNLYLNRGCTGALVGRQPFGGFGMSGLGSKAGGADYLKQFVVPRAVTENTMRRGFAPEMEGAAAPPGQVGGNGAAVRAGI